MMLMVNGVVSFAVIHIFSLPDNKMWIAFALLLLGMSVSALMQVGGAHQLHRHPASMNHGLHLRASDISFGGAGLNQLHWLLWYAYCHGYLAQDVPRIK